MKGYQYEGGELRVFALATSWKRYWRSRIESAIRGDVLEVGAGIGSNTVALRGISGGRWLCLEPDQTLLNELIERTATIQPPVDTRVGTMLSLPAAALFDTILYIDVLEHIADDKGELQSAASHLAHNGRLVVLSPAFNFLYSPFDRAIGHHRRYNRTTLSACTPFGCRLERMFYLDSAGLLLSLANRALLRQSAPDAKQILFWDRMVIPVSKIIDRTIFFHSGRSIVGIWRRV